MGQWVGDQGRPKLAKISKTCLICDVTSRNQRTENEKRFFPMSTRRLAESVDGLHSSLAQLPSELQDCKVLQKWGKPGTQRVKRLNFVISLPFSLGYMFFATWILQSRPMAVANLKSTSLFQRLLSPEYGKCFRAWFAVTAFLGELVCV